MLTISPLQKDGAIAFKSRESGGEASESPPGTQQDLSTQVGDGKKARQIQRTHNTRLTGISKKNSKKDQTLINRDFSDDKWSSLSVRGIRD